ERFGGLWIWRAHGIRGDELILNQGKEPSRSNALIVEFTVSNAGSSDDAGGRTHRRRVYQDSVIVAGRHIENGRPERRLQRMSYAQVIQGKENFSDANHANFDGRAS